jgi:hypothetical protein
VGLQDIEFLEEACRERISLQLERDFLRLVEGSVDGSLKQGSREKYMREL